jgi:hypothetical protein
LLSGFGIWPSIVFEVLGQIPETGTGGPMRLICLGLVLAAALPAASAQAQMACMKREVLVKQLTEKYKEVPSGQGLVGTTAMIEVYVSDKGTFTLVSSYTNGVSCILSAGDNWEMTAPPKKLTSM